jgi:hypothetical protein
MEKSEQIGQLATALAAAQGQMHSASKSAENPYFKSKYADLSAIVDSIKEPLNNNGIAYIQTTDIADGSVIVETMLVHTSGEWIMGRLKMRPVKDDPQGIGSCITYARRYGLQAIVGLDTEDDDGNAASGKSDGKQIEGSTTGKQQEKPQNRGTGAAGADSGELLIDGRFNFAVFMKPLEEAGFTLRDVKTLLGTEDLNKMQEKATNLRRRATEEPAVWKEILTLGQTYHNFIELAKTSGATDSAGVVKAMKSKAGAEVQSTGKPPAVDATKAPDMASEQQIKAIYAVGKNASMDNTAVFDLSLETYGVEPKDLTKNQAIEFMATLRKKA